jgi:hypothetical protein
MAASFEEGRVACNFVISYEQRLFAQAMQA